MRWQLAAAALHSGQHSSEEGEVTETRNLKAMAREVADLALQLAALPADGLRCDLQALADVEHMAMRILKEATAARAANVRPIGESSGTWRAVQPGLVAR